MQFFKHTIKAFKKPKRGAGARRRQRPASVGKNRNWARGTKRQR